MTQYLTHLLEYPLRLVDDVVCSSLLLSDEYVFSTYFTMLLQGIPRDSANSWDSFQKLLMKNIPGLNINEWVGKDIETHDQEKMLKIVSTLRHQFSEHVTTTYVKDFLMASVVYQALTNRREKAADSLSNTIHEMSKQFKFLDVDTKSSVQVNLTYLSSTISELTEGGKRLIEMNFLFSTDIRAAIFRDFLFSHVKNTQVVEHCIKTMINDTAKHGEALFRTSFTLGEEALADESLPLVLGIVNYDRKNKRLGMLSEFWIYTIGNYATNFQEFQDRFVKRVQDNRKRSMSGAIAKLKNVNINNLLEKFIVDGSGAAPDEIEDTGHGLNTLIYGSPKLDKIGFICDLLKKNDVEAYELQTKNSKNLDIPSICYVAQHAIQNLNRKFLIVERSEHALTKQNSEPQWMVEMFGGQNQKPKEDMLDSDELLLLKNPVPTFWMANSPRQITPENVARFLIHCELSGGSRKDRRGEVEKVITELGLPDSLIDKFSQYHVLNVEQVKSAGNLLNFLNIIEPENEKAMVNLVENSQRALDREAAESLRESVTKYSLDYLNISSKLPLSKLIDALKRNRSGTLCLYGLPGVGKTQLVEYLAKELDMPLVMKSASELLSKWLGEAEKNIAEAFEEAKAEDAILFIDEGDSFLRDRSLAQHSWEVTTVNELLQRMERFNGIFILATNLFESIDAAALRRFTFKMEFLALTEAQRMMMLHDEVGTEIDALDSNAREALSIEMTMIRHLTPGDFTVVKRQANLLGENLTIADWLQRLSAESKAKLEGINRSRGYQAESHHARQVMPKE